MSKTLTHLYWHMLVHDAQVTKCRYKPDHVEITIKGKIIDKSFSLLKSYTFFLEANLKGYQ